MQLPASLDTLLYDLDPLLSTRKIFARVDSLRWETAQACTINLRPARRWQGFQAGGHLPVGMPINGRLTWRHYSITSTPARYHRDGLISICVKRVKSGQMSTALQAHVKAGDVLQIGASECSFTWPTPSRDVLLMAAGSGITPLYSLLAQHLPRIPHRSIVLMYHCRQADEVIFRDTLQKWAQDYPGFRYQEVLTDSRPSRLCSQDLTDLCPDIRNRAVYLCGPTGYRERVQEVLSDLGVPADQVQQESFGVASPATGAAITASHRVQFRASGRETQSDGPKTLLVLAEEDGLSPRYGCRAGFCNECSCRKYSGRVRNLLTGATSLATEETIQPCISAPLEPLELEL